MAMETKTIWKKGIPFNGSSIKTNYIKGKIDKTQPNSKCRLCDDRNETLNRIIRESSKLAQREYKTGWER